MRLTCLIACTVFIFTLCFSGWHNDFPARYHPDEPDKVEQVLSGERDFHHPPLTLDATAAVLRLVNGSVLATPEHAVWIGRWLSAFYIAAACAAFTWIAGLYEGPLAAVLAACLLASNTDAVLAGHFFKEDSLFALGLSLTLLAGAYRWKNPLSRFSLVALGAAAGFAAATKYVGILALIYAIVLEIMLAHPMKPASRLRWRLLIVVLTAFAIMFLLSVSSWWNRFPAMWRALFEASQTAYRGNEGIGSKVPHWQFVGMFFFEPALALLGLALCWWAWTRQKRPALQYADCWLLLCAPLILVLVFSFSTITAVRYFLPISLLVSCLGGCGLAAGTKIARDWVYQKWRLPSGLTTGAVIGICALAQLPALGSLEKGFARDDRRALRAYIATELPASAVIAADGLADLDAAPPLPQRVLAQRVVADFGTLSELRARGITHVVVCWYDSRRYVNSRKHPAAGVESEFLRRREFYLDLRSRARLLWHSDIVQPFPLRPGLSLYELPPAENRQLSLQHRLMEVAPVIQIIRFTASMGAVPSARPHAPRISLLMLDLAISCAANNSLPMATDSTKTPAQLGYRMPAEWELHEATWLSWPRREGISFPDAFDRVMPAFRAMVSALVESERVCINVYNGAHEAEVVAALDGLPMQHITFHRIPTNEPWCRDHGPIFLTRREQPRLAIVDWDYNAWGGKYPPCDLDEVVPTRIGEILGTPVFYPQTILEGGSIDVNGEGALLTTESCLLNPNRNPQLTREDIEKRLRDFLGVREILWLARGTEGDDTDGHIDNLARFVELKTVLAAVEEDSASANYEPLQENLHRLRAMKIGGESLEIVELPMPRKIEREDLILPTSYANFYISNTCVLVPIFSDPNDERALEIIGPFFPSRRIVAIDCRELIWGLGAFHCLTQQQPET